MVISKLETALTQLQTAKALFTELSVSFGEYGQLDNRFSAFSLVFNIFREMTSKYDRVIGAWELAFSKHESAVQDLQRLLDQHPISAGDCTYRINYYLP